MRMPEDVAKILRLHQLGWGIRRIAEGLRVGRNANRPSGARVISGPRSHQRTAPLARSSRRAVVLRARPAQCPSGARVRGLAYGPAVPGVPESR